MQTTTLGSSDLEVPVMGLGCMSMSHIYGQADEAESIATVHRAMALGVNFFDTADVYGAGGNELLLSKALAGRRDEVVLATKCGIVYQPDGSIAGLSGKPDYIRSCCDASLERLGTDRIDLYYLHRPDPDTPIEDSVGAMAELVAAGKVRALGLSEVSGEQLRRAAAVHPIAALQSEYSLWCQGVIAECGDALRELNITLVPYSPLGRGLLTGRIETLDDIDEADFRHRLPQFAPENFERNRAIVDAVASIANTHGCQTGQAALAWVHGSWPGAVPIPGTKQRRHLESNLGALDVRLSDEDLAQISRMGQQVSGERMRLFRSAEPD